jgi:class 3 adenylate cyclase
MVRAGDVQSILLGARVTHASKTLKRHSHERCRLARSAQADRCMARTRLQIDPIGFASFEGPVRALRCAQAILDSVRPLGIEVRAGLHTGECDLIDDKVGGLAVNIGSRICDMAGPSEVLASQTVKDLVAGSGLRFEERGTRQLKGIPGEWGIFALAPERR